MSMSPDWTPWMLPRSLSAVAKVGRTETDPSVRRASSSPNARIARPSGVSSASSVATRMITGCVDAAAVAGTPDAADGATTGGALVRGVAGAAPAQAATLDVTTRATRRPTQVRCGDIAGLLCTC